MNKEDDKILSFEDIRNEKELLNKLKTLKKEQQQAVLWLMYHIGFLDIIASGKIMTSEEEQEWSERALKYDNYILMTLILYKKSKDKNEAEKQKNPLDRG